MRQVEAVKTSIALASKLYRTGPSHTYSLTIKTLVRLSCATRPPLVRADSAWMVRGSCMLLSRELVGYGGFDIHLWCYTMSR
jgi:hypothetical protein